MYNFVQILKTSTTDPIVFFMVRDRLYSINSTDYWALVTSTTKGLKEQFPDLPVWSNLSKNQSAIIESGRISADSFILSAWIKLFKSKDFTSKFTPLFILFMRNYADNTVQDLTVSFNIV